MRKYRFKYWFEWGCREDFCPCMWAADDYTQLAFNDEVGVALVSLQKLPISSELVALLVQLGLEHDVALNWKCPQDPLLWTKEEEKAFYKKAKEGYRRLVKELGSGYSIKYCVESSLWSRIKFKCEELLKHCS